MHAPHKIAFAAAQRVQVLQPQPEAFQLKKHNCCSVPSQPAVPAQVALYMPGLHQYFQFLQRWILHYYNQPQLQDL